MPRVGAGAGAGSAPQLRRRCDGDGRRNRAARPKDVLDFVIGSPLYLLIFCSSSSFVPPRPQMRALLSRSAFVMTETELRLMAAAAMIGLKRIPVNG